MAISTASAPGVFSGGAALRSSPSALLVKCRDGSDRHPYKIVRRSDDRVLWQLRYLIEALDAWRTWYAR